MRLSQGKPRAVVAPKRGDFQLDRNRPRSLWRSSTSVPGEGVTSAALIGNIGSGLSYVRSVLHRVPPCAWVKTAYGVPICREIEEQMGREVAVGSVYGIYGMACTTGNGDGMKLSKPRLWLRGDWNAFAPAQNDGALAGDLLEAYNRRRSAAWYWRQVLIGTETSCASEMPHHRRRATQAVVITWAAGYGAVVLGRRLVVEFFTHGVSQLGLALCVINLLGALLSGLIVALRNRRHRNAVLLTSAETLPNAGYWNGALLNRISSSVSFIAWWQYLDLRSVDSFSPVFPKPRGVERPPD